MKTQLRDALIVVLICFTAYLSNGRDLPLAMAGDTVPSRLIPFSILRFGTITLERFRADFVISQQPTWYARERHEQLVSLYPIGTALAALPFYGPSYVYLALRGQTNSSQLFHASERAEKLAASAMTALAIGAFF